MAMRKPFVGTLVGRAVLLVLAVPLLLMALVVVAEDIDYRRHSIKVEGVVVAHESENPYDSRDLKARVRFRVPGAEGGQGSEHEMLVPIAGSLLDYPPGKRVPVYVASHWPLDARVDPWGAWVFLGIALAFGLIAWFWPVRR